MRKGLRITSLEYLRPVVESSCTGNTMREIHHQ